jgi:hypothetical protein
VNLLRLHVVRHPDLAGHAAAFDALVDATPEGARVEYGLAPPKWWFLHHLVSRGYVLHGSNNGAIEEFAPKPNFDAHNVRHVEGVFASDDAIWPVYFATADRRREPRGLINWCEHAGRTSRYLFALEGEPTFTDGAVYALPRETFEPTPGSRELVSFVPVRPRLAVPVTPADFPLREKTIAFRRGESPRRVAIRHALRISSRARR